MTGSKGKENIIGLKVETTYGTAVQIAALDAFLVDSYEIQIDHQRSDDKSLNAGAMQEPDIIGAKRYALQFAMPARYIGGLDVLLGIMLGADAITAINNTGAEQVGTTHQMVLQSRIDGKHLTVAAWDKVRDEVEELTSFKPDTLEITDSPSGFAVVTVSGPAQRYRRSGKETVTNTTVTMASATINSQRSVASFNDLVIKINDQSAGDVASEAAVPMAGYTLRIQRSYKDTGPDGLTRPYVPEQQDDDYPQVTLTVPKHSLDDYNFEDDYMDGTPKKASIVYDDAVALAAGGFTADAGQDHRIAFYLPYLQPTENPKPVGGPGMRGESISFVSRRVPSGTAPTGMASATVYVELDNERAAAIVS